LNRPDSIDPLKSVWGLTRFTRPIQSASEATRSSQTGMPMVSPTCTMSMAARISHPIAASVMP
jgi:hypothetical protein